MDDGRKILPFDAQRLYPVPPTAFNDVRLTSGGQSGACTDLLGRPSPLTPVDFMATLQGPYNYMVSPHGWGIAASYLGPQQQKHSSGHPIHHQQRIGGNLSLGTSAIYQDALNPFYGVPQRNLWGPCFSNQLDPAILASYWLQQQQHHHQQQQQQQQQQHHQQQQQQQLSQHFSGHLQPPRCDIDDCRRERRHRDRRPKSALPNRPGEEECEEEEQTESGQRKVVETNEKRPNRNQRSLSRNRTNNNNNNNNKSGYQDNANASSSNGGQCRLRRDIKEDVDDDVAIVAVEGGASVASTAAQQRLKLEAAAIAAAKVPSTLATTTTTRISASPDTTTLTSSFLGAASSAKVSDVMNDAQKTTTTTFDDVKSELDLGYHHYHDLGDHPRSPHHHRLLVPTQFKTEPENQFRGSKNSLSSKNSFGSNFRISDIIAVDAAAASSPMRSVKVEGRDQADSGGFKNDKSVIPSPTDSKLFIHDLQSQLGVPGFESQPEAMDFSSGRRSTSGFANADLDRSPVGAIKCEENVASTTVAVTSSASPASAAAAAFDVKIEDVGLSPLESKQHRSCLLSDLEKNLGSFHKSQKLSLEMPDSVSCVSLSCHMGEYRVSHQKSGHRVGKVYAPTYLPEIGQPDTLSTTQNGATTTTTTTTATLSASSASSAPASSLSTADVLCTGIGTRRPTTKKRKKSSSSSSSSPRIASSSPPLSPVAMSIAQRTSVKGSGVKRDIVAAGILGDVHLKLESSTDHHEAGSNPVPRHDSSSPFDRNADGSTLLMDDIPCCYRPDDVGVIDCTDVECRSPFEAEQLACHQPLVGLSGCLSSRPGRMAGHCAKSFSTANSPSVPVGVARALQRSCNSGGGGCWRGSSSLSSPACSNHHLVRCSMETKDHALLQVNPNSGEESIFLNRTTPSHQSSSSSSSSSSLPNPSGYKSTFSSHNLFHPQNPHAPLPHCSLDHHHHHNSNFLGGLLHGDHPHMDHGDDDVVGSCFSRGKDVHSGVEVVSLVPGKASRSKEQDGFSPLDLTKNKERVNLEAEASTTADASVASDSLSLASSKSTAGKSCVTSHALNSGKFCLCCCPCCCLFKSRILSKACSHLFASPSSTSPSLQAPLATTASLHPNQSNGKIVSTESRATSPMEWSPPFQLSDSGKILRDSETQTEPAPKNSIPSLANPFQVSPSTHQSFLASSSSTLSYTDAEEMRISVDGSDEVFDFGGLSILSSVAEAAGQLPGATRSTGRLSILDIPVSVFMELPETSPVVERQRTPPAELPPSPDLTLNYNVPRSNVFFRSSAADGDNRLQQLQRHFNDTLSSNNGEMTSVIETGVAGEMLDNELYLRKKLEEVKCLYQQNKKEVAKLERLSSQKAKNKKQRKDHPATSTASASTTTASSSTVAKSRHVPGHKVSTSNSSSRHETVATTSTTLATQTPVSSESLTTTIYSSASLRVSLTSLTSSTTPSPVVTPTAPILTSASLDPVQVKGGGSDEPPKLSFSGVVSSCGGVDAQVKLEKEDHVVEGGGEVGIGLVSKPPKKKRKNSNGSSTGKENHRGRSASDFKSEENEASDPERDWLFRRRSERIFLHQPFMTPIGKVKEETQPMSEDTPLDKDQKSADESDLRFHDIKTLPLSPLSLPPVPITEDNNNTFIKDIYNNNNNVEGTDVLFHNKLPVSSALPFLIGSLNSPPEFSTNPQPKDDIQTIDVPKVELEVNSDPTKVKNEDLVDGLKVLYLREQCFVEATVRNISPPDIYGVVVDRDRSRRPDILSLEELLSKIVRVIQPSSRDQLPTGSRVCVLWSGRSNSFYPGTVLEDEEEDGLEGGKNEALHDSAEKRSTNGGNKDVQLNIDFDDGDSGWFPIEQIRMLPSNFPIQKVEMSLDSVLAASRKKRSSSSQAEYGAPQKISKKRSEGDVATSKTPKNHGDLTEHPLAKEVHKAPRNESRQQKTKVKDSRPMNPASIPGQKFDQRAKNSQLLEKFHEKMTKVKRDVSGGIDAFKKKENKQNVDTSKKKELSPAKIVFEERPVFKLEKKDNAESSTGTMQKFEQKKDSHFQRGSHFQNIFEEMKKLKSEERAPKSFRDPSNRPLPSTESNRPLPSTESNPKKDSSFFSCLGKDVKRENKKESTGIAKQPGNDKNLKKQSKKARKTSKKESGSSGNEDCTSDGTSGSIRKKRKQSVSSCSEPSCPEKSNKLPKVLQNPHPVCSAAAHITMAIVSSNTTATTAISSTDSIPSPSAKCKRSFSPEKYEEAVEVPTWQWYGAGVKRQGIKGKSRKTFYKAIKRGNEIVEVGNSVVFLSNGKSKFKFVGCVESFWENPDGSKSVKVKWYYHPEETRGGANQIQFTWRALFQSSHEDENDLQTISHKCQILSFKDFKNLLSTTATTDNNKSPFKQSSAARQSSVTSSPFLPSIPTAAPSFSITPFTSNLSTLKQNSSIRGGYLVGSGSVGGSGGGPTITPGGCNLPCEVYYLAGTYEPTRNYIWFEPGVPLLKDRDRFLVPSTAMSSALPVLATSNTGNTSINGDDDSVGN